MKKFTPENSGADFGDVQKVYKGRLAYKGSLAPNSVRGYILDLDQVVPGNPFEEMKTVVEEGEKVERYKYSIVDIYNMAVRQGIKEPAILKMARNNEDNLFRVNSTISPVVGLVSNAGVTCHGFVMMQDTEEYRKPSRLIAAGAVENIEELSNGDYVDLEVNGQEVLIKKMKLPKTHK